GIAPERVVVTGAQCFDEWFEWQPRPREEFCSRAGLDPTRPFVLYACCSPWTGQSEVEFVRRWTAAVRAHGGPLAGVGVPVRPHGLGTAATPVFVDEVERLAASAAPRPQRTPAPLLPLRPLLAPLAARAGRFAQ